MKITKYPQSCLLIESNDTRVLIDPGSFVAEKYTADLFGQIDAVLITHEHADHAHAQLIAGLKVGATKVYANRSTQLLLGDLVTDIASDGQTIDIGTLKVGVRDLPHVDMPDGSPGPQNTGYIIDDVLFHPGDGIKIEGVSVPVGAVPIAGPDISPRDVFDFAKSIGCKVAIPIHYDYFIADPVFFANFAQQANMPFQIVPLKEGESYDTDDLVAVA
jgi:L-ascorbate metabolism protein UlaG (beta-lactamase superfamily)